MWKFYMTKCYLIALGETRGEIRVTATGCSQILLLVATKDVFTKIAIANAIKFITS
jgi:hypothetical protein